MKGCLLAALALVGVILLLGGCGVSKYNGIVAQQENVDAKFVEITNQYKRRADLIPNLVKTVEGARDFERETLEAVIAKRQAVTNIQVPESVVQNPEAAAAFFQAQQGLTSALTRLLAVSENYPDLKATQAFRDLTVALEGTENRIAVARRDYIETVRSYNTAIKQFPGTLVAMLAGFEKMPQLEIEGEHLEDAPTVDFGNK